MLKQIQITQINLIKQGKQIKKITLSVNIWGYFKNN